MRHVERAPAKINLSLRVVGKREDGYHEIETLMAPVDGLEDRLEFDLEEGDGEVVLNCRGGEIDVPSDGSNLVLRALGAFATATGRRFTGEVRLDKTIPCGAGLGGGSSDAAATLRALDQIAGTALPAGELRSVASEIGSDVPFFVGGEPAWCRGRGEEIAPLDGGVEPCELLLVKPAFGVSSAWAYSRWAESEEIPGVDYAPRDAPWGVAVNDLERPVFEKYLVLAAIKGWLAARAETGVALMSGSGATVFATLVEGADREALVAAARGEFGDDTWIGTAAIAAG